MFVQLAALSILAISPEAQSPVSKLDRSAILEALRPRVEAEVGPNVEFVVTMLRKERMWAFVQVEPQRRGGKPIDGRLYFGSSWENMDGLTTTAILRHIGGRWHIVDMRIGATDAWYCGHLPVEQFDPCEGYSK